MKATLYDETPLHKENFIQLVNEWYYDGLLFHRIIENFMIQWWDPDSRDAAAGVPLWRWWPWYQINAEIWKPHIKWTLAAARTWWPSNPEKKSSGSQFYIVQWIPQTEQSLAQFEAQKWITYSDEEKAQYISLWWTPALDNEYTVFWELTEWYDVLDAIAAAQKDRRDRPLEDITMSITIE